jgi:fibronectin-binding autotransporter adhesin
MVDRMKQAMSRGSGRGRDRRRIEHHDAVATGPVRPRWPVAPVVAACLLAFGCGPAWAANGGGGKALFGLPVDGLGGIDGTASMATGKDGAPTGSSGNGAGGGAVNLTTGAGAAGGQPSVGATNIDAPGANGGTGAIGVSTVSGTITGGVGQAGHSVNTGVGSTGGGGGGAGVTTTVDLTVGNADRVTGGAGGAGGTDAGSGGGGVGVFSSANVAVAAGGVVIGGAGGNSAAGSGGAGGGAAAIVLTAEGAVDNGGALTGGHGGGAGSTFPSLSGAGGSGGEGVLLTAGGAVINRAGASITGGTAGTNGTAIAAQGIAASVGGAGIEGANVSIINAGAITGGQTAPGTLANAIQFTGGVNSLELQAGSTITGNVVAFSAADTLALGGDTDSSFNVSTLGATAQYQGFGIYNKTGASTWTLTGATTAVTPWTLTAGTLSISSDGNLGDSTGALTFDGGTLQTTADITMNRATTLDAAGGTIETQTGTTLTQQGQISGAGGLTKTGDGTLTLTANNAYTGGTTISGGTLQLGNGGTTGSLVGNVTDNGTLVFNRSDTMTLAGAISGTGAVNQIGTGTTVLTADNTYTGGTTISAGTLQIGNGGTTGSLVGNVTDNGALAFNRSDVTTFDGVISGTGTVNESGTGTTILTGANTYTGATSINAGTLLIDGNQSAANRLTSVNNAAILGGTGTIGGSVNVATGGVLAPGDMPGVPGTLTINGGLSLVAGSTLNYDFGEANTVGGTVNDLTKVGGNLVLDGTLNVATPGGAGLGIGLYRVISYAGALTDNGLQLGTVPPGSQDFIQTSVANQVNLVNTQGLTLRYWDGAAGPKNDGAVNGGDGFWQNPLGNDNWTDISGAFNAPYTDSAFAVFESTPGTVTVDGSLGAIAASGMQFASNGYLIKGDAITLVGPQAVVRVGDGTTDGAGYTATIASELNGASQLVKTDLGTLVLTGADTYSGGTMITSGTLQLGNGGTSGSILGDVANNGTLAFDRSDELDFTGAVSGTGAVNQIGTGMTVLTGANTYTGGTTISAGTLQLGNGGTSGSVVGDIANNGTLIFDRSNELDLSGNISGTGVVNQIGTGTTVLSGTNTYTGGTTISAGVLQLGAGAASGSLTGDVTDNGQLAFDRSDVASFEGVVSGAGSLAQIGVGTTVLNAANNYSGGTTVSAGTLAVGDAAHAGATLGAGATTVAAGATLGGYGTVPGQVTNMGTIAAANAVAAFAASADGTFTIGGDLVNQGTANLAAASGQSANVLNVGGNYTGSNATLMLNTVLNTGDAATKTDQLSIAGNASGDTAIRVHGTGAGAQTTGDGIKLVGVAGTAAANSFHLANAVQGGAFQYLLYQGGATAANNNWYLRSTFEAPPADGTSPASDPTGAPGGAGGPSGTATSALAFRPGTVAYSTTPALNTDYGFTTLGRLQERVGDVASVEANPQNKDAALDKDGFWGRISGEDLDANSSNRFSAQQNTYLAQFGKDWTLARTASGGSTHAGATMTFGSSSSTFDDSLRSLNPQLTDAAGSVETQAQSVGGYWTRYLADGTYVDGVGQLTHFQNKYGDVLGDSASQNGFSVGASAEVGKPFLLVSTSVAIEPQAQLLYQYLHLNGFDDGVSPISSTSTNALRGRVGFRLFRANLSNDGGTAAATPYLTADMLHDFFSPGQTSVGGTAFESDLSKTWYEVGVGVTSSAGKSSELYFNVKYARNVGGQYQRSVFGQAGYRYSW